MRADVQSNQVRFNMTTIDLTDDTIYTRDLIERVEDLESSADDNGGCADDVEYQALSAILEKLADEGGDEHWRGAWYPQYLIKDGYFETYMDELLADCGDLPKDLPAYLSIAIDYVMLRSDYTPIEIKGATYWYR